MKHLSRPGIIASTTVINDRIAMNASRPLNIASFKRDQIKDASRLPPPAAKVSMIDLDPKPSAAIEIVQGLSEDIWDGVF